MTRLIACDIDGTLLLNGAVEIPGEIFRQIDRLEGKGILFCPASGRQYSSLRKLFAPVADRVPYLCENGAVIYGPGSPGPVLGKTVMDRALAEELCREIIALSGVEVLISGANTSYVCPKRDDLLDRAGCIGHGELRARERSRGRMRCPGARGGADKALRGAALARATQAGREVAWRARRRCGVPPLPTGRGGW